MDGYFRTTFSSFKDTSPNVPLILVALLPPQLNAVIGSLMVSLGFIGSLCFLEAVSSCVLHVIVIIILKYCFFVLYVTGKKKKNRHKPFFCLAG